MASTWRVTPGAALHGEAGRLVQDDHLRILVQDRGLQHLAVAALAAAPPARGVRASPACSGGTRTSWPAASRVEVSTRAPSTRTWPERMQLLQMAEAEARESAA